MTRDVLVVGINQYCNFDPLDTPAGDAEAIAQLLEQYGEFNVVKRLPECTRDDKFQVDPNPQGLEAQVTVEKLQLALEQLFDPKGDNIPGTALFFFAGHGHRVKNQNGQYEGFLATCESDTDPAKGKPGLSLQWLWGLLQNSPVREQIIWLDCCHSGELLNFEEVNPAFWKGHDCCFIAASRGHEVSYQHPDGKHGLLTAALLEGLDPTRLSKGKVNGFDLISFVHEKRGWPQRPVCFSLGQPIELTKQETRNKTRIEQDVPSATPILTSKQKLDFVAVLLGCETIQNSDSRSTILNQLPSNIVNNIRSVAQTKTHVINIVDTCLRYDGGLTKLVEALRFVEGDSLNMRAVDETLKKLGIEVG